MKSLFRNALFAAALTLAGTALADTVTSDVAQLQHGWAQVYYSLPKDQKDVAFGKLEEEAKLAVARNPGRAEPLVWCAIIESSHAKFAGGLHALDLIKHARKLLLDAEKVDPQVLGGSIYTSLGSLYAKAPGWPLSFGDKKKAAEYLKQALAINPDGIDPNFFYGELLTDTGNAEAGRRFLEKALNAPPREGREDADAGRRAEIQAALADLD
ncbi:hypothetical protein B1810_03070 [Panacagrimonas perspica]|nr:hypothetical protein B1810_03070 [Panacagrimonas perspica]